MKNSLEYYIFLNLKSSGQELRVSMNISSHLEQRCYRKASLQHSTNLGGLLAGPQAEPGAAVLHLVALYQQKTSRPHRGLAAGWYRDTLMWKVMGWEV